MSYNATLEIPNVVVVSGPAGQSFRPVDDAAELTADFGRDGDRAIIRANGDEWLKTAGVWAATGENFWGTLLAQGAAQVQQAAASATQAQSIADEFGDLEAGITLAQAAAAAAAGNAGQTAADRAQTGLDRAATGADAGQTAADRIATAADRAQTGLDRAATAADAGQTAADRVATTADRAQTGIDRAATSADAGQTAADRVATAADVALANAAIGGTIYDTTAAGIAATTNGQFFIVKGDGVNTYALMYKNVATVATLVASYPSKESLDLLLAMLATGAIARTNLFNPAAAIDGQIVSASNGNLSPSSTYFTSAPIPVVAGQSYTVPARNSLAWKNAAGVFLSGSGTVAAVESTIVAPANAVSLQISVVKSQLLPAAMSVVHGTTLPYPRIGYDEVIDGGAIRPNSLKGAAIVDHSITPKQVNFIAESKNKFDKTAVTDGFMSASGVITTPSGVYSISDYIDVEPLTAYHGADANGGMRFWTFFYDVGVVAPGGSNASGTDFTTPAGVKKVKVSVPTVGLDTFQLELGSVKTAYEQFGYGWSKDKAAGALANFFNKTTDTLDAIPQGTTNKHFTSTSKVNLELLASILLNGFSSVKSKILANISDVTIQVIGDSTGNDDTDWVRPWSQWLASLYPDKTVKYYLWDESLSGYRAPVTLGVGTGAHTIYIYNGSQSGAPPNYFFGSYYAVAIGAITPDLVIWNHGHNVTTDSDPATRGQFLNAMEWIKRVRPNAAHVITMQNPRRDDTGSDLQIHVAQALAAQYGDSVVDVYDRFIAAAKPPEWYADNVHPNATGQAVWTEIVKQAWSGCLPATIAPNAAFTNTRAQNLLNLDASGVDQGYGYFKNYINGTPAGWTVQGGATFAKDLAIFDAEMGDTFSVKITGAAALAGAQRSLSAPALTMLKAAGFGTLAIRKYVPPASDQAAGRTAFLQSGTGAVNCQSQPDIYRQGKWVWDILASQPAGGLITFATPRIYTNTSAIASVVHVGRVVLVAGAVPRDDQAAPSA
ncbi:hypothetical protein NKH91_17815 [Mesorhizobium sp. M0894]|uniref:hypothetical protein n=1 Tax=unclassified Mesorhizobium TaxID=325217 RepID=UPI0033381D56